MKSMMFSGSSRIFLALRVCFLNPEHVPDTLFQTFFATAPQDQEHGQRAVHLAGEMTIVSLNQHKLAKQIRRKSFVRHALVLPFGQDESGHLALTERGAATSLARGNLGRGECV